MMQRIYLTAAVQSRRR